MADCTTKIITLGKFYLGLMVLYSLVRLLFIGYNYDELDDSTGVIYILLTGLRYDFSAVLLVNGFFALILFLPQINWIYSNIFKNILVYILFIINSIFLFLNFIDVVYFPFVRKRLQNDALLFANGDKGDEAFNMIPTFAVQFWYIWLLLIMVLVFLAFIIKQMVKSWKQFNDVRFSLISLICLLFVAAIHVYGIRGGMQLRPINILDASNSVGVKNAPFALNSTFSLIRTWGKNTLEEKHYFQQPIADPCFDPIKTIVPKDSTPTKPNVLVLMVESLSKEYISYWNGTGYTPFLDSLMAQSYVYSNAFANARESVQGIPAVLASIPAWMDEPFIFSRYSSNQVQSFANVLKPFGYQSWFFHGATSGSMGFQSFTKSAGFDHYIGREDYNNEEHFDGSWGIWDHYFLPFMADKLSTSPQPFFAATLTLNTHHPFLLPQGYLPSKPNGKYPILNSIQYVDQSLRDFFKKIADLPWYANTIFVITADHTGPKTSKKANVVDDYRVPVIIFDPKGTLCGEDQTIINHIDLMPTVLDFINIETKLFSFGHDIVDETCHQYTIQYKMGIYQYLDEQYCAYFDGEKCFGLYLWTQDKGLKKNISNDPKYKDAISEIEKVLKYNIQNFNHAIINNKMSVNAKPQ